MPAACNPLTNVGESVDHHPIVEGLDQSDRGGRLDQADAERAQVERQ